MTTEAREMREAAPEPYRPKPWDAVYLETDPPAHGVVIQVYPHLQQARVRFGCEDQLLPWSMLRPEEEESL